MFLRSCWIAARCYVTKLCAGWASRVRFGYQCTASLTKVIGVVIKVTEKDPHFVSCLPRARFSSEQVNTCNVSVHSPMLVLVHDLIIFGVDVLCSASKNVGGGGSFHRWCVGRCQFPVYVVMCRRYCCALLISWK